jgi:hypothetical protein
MRVNKMQEHVARKRLLQLAGEEIRLTETEFSHLEDCDDCRTLYGKAILQVAREHARDKIRHP